MDYYLFTARSATQAQRMLQVLGMSHIHGAIQRLPVGLSHQGCTYAVRVSPDQYSQAQVLIQRENKGTIKIFAHDSMGFHEVTL